MANRASRKGLGSVSGKTTKSLALDRVDRPNAKRVKGIYPKGEDAGRFGGTRYATVLEQYNRQSDYARWRHGQQFFHGIGHSSSDRVIGVRSRFMLGDRLHVAQTILTMFPSSSSADHSWTTARRIRGSVVSATPFDVNRATLDLNPSDPSQDRLIYRVADEFSDDQMLMKHLQLLVGDQIEDSFTGPDPADRVGEAVGSTALTLVGVDPEEKTLVFDLSKPQGRVLTNGDKIRWARLQYNPGNPWDTIWKPGNHIGTSIHFHCNCPDFSKSMTANTQSTEFGSSGRRFPLPPASRRIRGDYEAEMAGFMKKWGDLSIRADERQECKHIHCLRWQTRTPWYEPNDMPLDMRSDRIHAGADQVRGDAFDKMISQYYRNAAIDWSGVVASTCGALGFNTSPTGDMSRRADRPILWQLDHRPEPEHCRQNDYWLERGTKKLWLYMAEADEWVNELTDEEGNPVPIVDYMEKEETKRLLKETQ